MSTIKDVAKAAGVSPGTVSNALSGNRPVSPETRRRVFEAVESLGYKPNLLARSLVSQRSHTFAVVTPEIESYGPAHILNGIDREAEALNYSILLTIIHDPAQEDVADLIMRLKAHQVDGIIWAVGEIGNNQHWFQPARLHTLPPIVFLSTRFRKGYKIVSSDHRAGARQAVQHLIEQGRRTIGLISGPLAWWEAQERQNGWQQQLQKHSLEHSVELCLEGDWSAHSGFCGLQELLNRRPDIDGVLVGNDPMAVGALGAAIQLGRQVPHQLAIVGFDDVPTSRYYSPALTTIRQDLNELGRLCVQLLHQMVEPHEQVAGKETVNPKSEAGSASWILLPAHVVLQPQLIVRESSVVPIP